MANKVTRVVFGFAAILAVQAFGFLVTRSALHGVLAILMRTSFANCNPLDAWCGGLYLLLATPLVPMTVALVMSAAVWNVAFGQSQTEPDR